MYSWRPNGVLLFVSQGQDFSMQKTSSQVSDGGGVSWYIMRPWLLIMTQTIKAIKAVDTCHNFGIVFPFFIQPPPPPSLPPKKRKLRLTQMATKDQNAAVLQAHVLSPGHMACSRQEISLRRRRCGKNWSTRDGALTRPCREDGGGDQTRRWFSNTSNCLDMCIVSHNWK